MPPMPDVAELMQAEMPRQLHGQQHRPPVEAYARKRLSALPPCGADAAAASPERTLIPALHRVHSKSQPRCQIQQERRQQHH